MGRDMFFLSKVVKFDPHLISKLIFSFLSSSLKLPQGACQVLVIFMSSLQSSGSFLSIMQVKRGLRGVAMQ